MVDKYTVRIYVKEKIERRGITCSDIGLNFIPLLGVWDKVEDIDFDILPNQFVLKPNHASEVIICRDKLNNDYHCKKGLLKDIEEVKAYLNYRMKQNSYKASREWPYKNVKKKIICEKYMNDDNSDFLIDYKFYCFNGDPRLLYVQTYNDGELCIDFFDLDFIHMDIFRLDHPNNISFDFSCPNNFQNMIIIVKKLAVDIPFVRVDLYEIQGKVYFGELTFFLVVVSLMFTHQNGIILLVIG